MGNKINYIHSLILGFCQYNPLKVINVHETSMPMHNLGCTLQNSQLLLSKAFYDLLQNFSKLSLKFLKKFVNLKLLEKLSTNY